MVARNGCCVVHVEITEGDLFIMPHVLVAADGLRWALPRRGACSTSICGTAAVADVPLRAGYVTVTLCRQGPWAGTEELSRGNAVRPVSRTPVRKQLELDRWRRFEGAGNGNVKK